MRYPNVGLDDPSRAIWPGDTLTIEGVALTVEDVLPQDPAKPWERLYLLSCSPSRNTMLSLRFAIHDHPSLEGHGFFDGDEWPTPYTHIQNLELRLQVSLELARQAAADKAARKRNCTHAIRSPKSTDGYH